MKLAVAFSMVAGALAGDIIRHDGPSEHGITNSWIVTVAPHSVEAWKGALMSAKVFSDVDLKHSYNIGNGSFLGFSARIESEDTLRSVADLPGVMRVEQDALVFATQTSDRPIDQAGHWGLDRGDGRFDDVYHHATDGGDGVAIYILDTGVRTTHNDYQGRAEFGINFTNFPDGDNHGHGTHCGCTAGGGSHGIASEATVVDVKVLGDSGSGAWSDFVAGVNWADEDCQQRSDFDVCVQSASLGGGANQSADDAVNAAAGSRSAMIIASGNSNADACSFSPARAVNAFSVNSAQRSGTAVTRSSFSNYGSCTQIYSAGSTVLSCGVSSDTATATMSGTSMATPHVAGHAAVCINKGGARSVQDVYNCLTSNQDEDAVGNNPSGPNGYAQWANPSL